MATIRRKCQRSISIVLIALSQILSPFGSRGKFVNQETIIGQIDSDGPTVRREDHFTTPRPRRKGELATHCTAFHLPQKQDVLCAQCGQQRTVRREGHCAGAKPSAPGLISRTSLAKHRDLLAGLCGEEARHLL